MSEPANGVLVSGTGRVPVRPDVLAARLGAEVTAGSVQDALDRCSAALIAMAAALRGGAVNDADLTTAGASVYAAHDHDGNQRGWTATQQLTARLRDLGIAGDLVSRALAASGDAGRLHDLTFEVADDAPARADARRLAFADARATAELYAELAGRELGAVRAVTEGVDRGSPRPLASPAMARAATSMPIEAGSLEVTVSVSVQWTFVG